MSKEKEIQNIIDNAPTKKDALEALEALRIFGNLPENEYKKAKEKIKKEFF